MTLRFSVCAPSHLARSWVQRAEVLGGSLVLYFYFFRIFSWNASLFFRQVCRRDRFLRLARNQAVQYEITQTSFFVRISFGAEAFYLVFRLLVALKYNVRGLKTMSRMCHC